MEKSIVSSSKIPSPSVYPRGTTRGKRFNRHKYLSIGNNRWSAVRRAGKREKDLPALSRKLKGVPRRGRPAARQSSSLISRHSRFFHFYRCKHRAKGFVSKLPIYEGSNRDPFLIYCNLIPRFEPCTGHESNEHGGGS